MCLQYNLNIYIVQILNRNEKKKILITGAAGFIGSHLTSIYQKYKIIAFDRYNSDNNWGWLENSLKKNIEFVLGDIRDYDLFIM